MDDPRPLLHADIRDANPGWLRLPISSLPPLAERQLLERWLTAAKVQTVDALLTAPCSAQRLCALAEQWARAGWEAGVPAPEDIAETEGVSLTRFESWAVAHSVADMLSRTLTSVLKKGETTKALNLYGKNPTLREVLLLGRGAVGLRADYAALVMDVLEQEADERAPAVEAERAYIAQHKRSPENGVLRGWWSLLRTERARLRVAAGPPDRATTFDWSLSPNGNRLTARGGVFTDDSRLDIVVRPWTSVPFLTQLQHWPATALVALIDGLLDLITGVADGPVLADLLFHLERPPWERDLAAVDRALRPELERAPGERLGWRVLGDDATGWTVSPMWVSKSDGAATYAVRPVTDLTEAELCVEAPGDPEVLALCGGREGRRAVDHAMLHHLVGHPRVFSDARPGHPLEVVRADVVLYIDPEPDGGLRFTPRVDGATAGHLLQRAHKEGNASGTLAVWRSGTRLALARAPTRTVAMVAALLVRLPTTPPTATAAVLQRVPAMRELLAVVVDPSLNAP